jgi:hypothetical protein
VTKSDTAAAGAQEAPAEKAGFFRDWVMPVALGLALGVALVWAWRAGSHHFHSDAWNIVAPLGEDEAADTEAAAKALRALGASARSDLVDVLHDLPPSKMEYKAWVAEQLAGEPWFDTTSLKEIVRNPGAAKEDRRAAACALAASQQKEVDAELVLPVFVEWLLDATSPDRGLAISHVDRMWQSGMLTSKWEQEVVRALRKCAERVTPPQPEMADRFADDRAVALYALSRALPDDEIRNLFVSVALDEQDDNELARINSVRALADGNWLDAESIPTWAKIAKTATPNIRQTVADNLYKATLPEFDQVLEPLQFDAKDLTRFGALGTQIKRRRPTMLARFDEFLEDSVPFVRADAMFACGVFKNQTEGLPQRAAMILRILETSSEPEDVEGAILAMKLLTDKVYEFPEADVHERTQTVEETPLHQFMADTASRKSAADKWRAHFGAACVWTDGDREKTLTKLLTHADPANVERAKEELAALKKK